MLLLGRASSEKQGRTGPQELESTDRSFRSIHDKCHSGTIYEIDLVKAHDTGLKFYQTFSYAVVRFGDVPAECVARVVGHDDTILCERPSEVAPHAPAIQA